MADTEPSIPIATGLAYVIAKGDTSQVCADAYGDKPFRLLDAFGIVLWIWQGGDIDIARRIDFAGVAVAYEDGFTAPAHGDSLSSGNA